MKTIALGLLMYPGLLVHSAAQAQNWINWPSGAGGNGHSYALTTAAHTNWANAEAEADRFQGGHLVSITSQAEQTFIEQTFLTGNAISNVFWIGLNDIVSAGTYVWSSGEAATYFNWAPGEPNNAGGIEDVAIINSHLAAGWGQGYYGKWNDYPLIANGWPGGSNSFYGIMEVPHLIEQFTKITTGSIVSDGGDSIGCAWGDYDNDGYLDLFVANHDVNSFLYRNNRDGTFTKVTTGSITSGNTWGSIGCGWGDYDNDGYLDLFVASDPNNLLFHNNGDGTFAKVTSGSPVDEGKNCLGVAWGDYDKDGYLDLFVGHATNGLFYRNNGDGTFTKIVSGTIGNDSGGVVGCAWGDYDNNGTPDLFVARDGANNSLYRNEGDGSFTKITSGSIVNDGGRSFQGAWGDYDNDGYLDLFVSRQGGQNNALRGGPQCLDHQTQKLS
jgi:hypothetical protein